MPSMKPVAYSPRVLRLAAPLAALALLVAGGCSTILGFKDTTLTEDGGPGEGEGGSEAGTPKVSYSPLVLLLRRGNAAGLQITFTVNRNGITGDISASIPDLPTGVTATPTPLIIPSNQSTGTITLKATTSAPLGLQNVHFSSQANPSLNTPLPLFIADSPGTLDTTFGSSGGNVTGVVRSSGAGNGATYDAAFVQSDGSILVGGAGANGNGWLLERYLANGFPDTTFNTNVLAGPQRLPTTGEIRALAVDSTRQKIVCVGLSTPQQQGAFHQMTVVRVRGDGMNDSSIGGGTRYPLGETAAVVLTSTSIGNAVALDPLLADGSIFVAGTQTDVAGNAGVVAHLLQDGSLDPAFNKGNPITSLVHSSFIGIAPAANGSFVVGGTYEPTISVQDDTFYVARYSSVTGALDTTFGNNQGLLFGTGFSANGFAATNNGSFVLVGGFVNNNGGGGGVSNNYTVGLASPGDTPQSALYSSVVATGYPNVSFNSVAVQNDGYIVAAGSAPNNEARVTRINPNQLALDTTFGSDGSFVATPGQLPLPTFNAIAIQPDSHRIVVAGSDANGAVIYGLWQ